MRSCRTHGELNPSHWIKSGRSKKGTQLYKCNLCLKSAHANHYARNKEKVIEKVQEYKRNNPDKIVEIRREYFQRTKDEKRPQRNLEKKRWNKKNLDKRRAAQSRTRAKSIALVNDSYVVQQLCRDSFLKAHQIPKELIELKRITMLVKRCIKQAKQNNLIKRIQEKIDERQSKKHESTKRKNAARIRGDV